MNLGIGTVAVQFLSWEYFYRIFVIVSLQSVPTIRTSTKAAQMVEGRRGCATLAVDWIGRVGPSLSVSESVR